jgi:uncharacterized protein (TIGR03790 family)
VRWANVVILVLGLALVGPVAWGAISPDNVLVLYNAAWSDGAHSGGYVADYYASQRGVPSSNVIGLTGLGTGEEISAADYLNVIWPQVESALATRNISTIVTTKGLPLRIRNDTPNPAAPSGQYTYNDAAGIQRTLYSDTWKTYSSLESELTRVNTIGTRSGPDWLNTALLQMGDQTYMDLSVPNPAANPYYRKTAAFNHSNPAMGGMYLTSRLDGFTVADVTSSIDKAKKAFMMPTSSYIVMDDDPNADVDRMPQLKNVLVSNNQKYVYDNTADPVTTAPGLVMGYVSHGTHGGGLNPGYIPNQLSFTLTNGAVFSTFESFNGYSFEQGGNHAGQGLVAEWIAKGGTAGIGNVEEPMNGSDNVANEDQMFKMLLNGYTWGEAAWSSLRQLSYVNTVVGDPLMTWNIPGDANLDGTVTMADLAVWRSHVGATGEAGGAMFGLGDFNCDGTVDLADLNVWKTNLGRTLPGPVVPSGAGTPVPEPSTLVLLTVVLAAALLSRRRLDR